MKKEYETPKAEKVEFNYSEAVVASGCGNYHMVGDQFPESNCSTTSLPDTYYVSNQA